MPKEKDFAPDIGVRLPASANVVGPISIFLVTFLHSTCDVFFTLQYILQIELP